VDPPSYSILVRRVQSVLFGLVPVFAMSGCAQPAAVVATPIDDVEPPRARPQTGSTPAAVEHGEHEPAQDITGAWVGTYVRQESGVDRSSVVAFTLDVVVEQQRLRGRMIEHGLADDDDDGEVVALVEGVVGDDAVVRFTKHYAPSTGLAGISEYVGRHDAVTGRIEGTWSTQGAQGRFAMRRDGPGPQLALRTSSSR
jgi:hypothetical protein